MCIMLYGARKVSINKIAKIFGMWWSLVCRWISEASEKLPDYEIKGDVKEVKFD